MNLLTKAVNCFNKNRETILDLGSILIAFAFRTLSFFCKEIESIAHLEKFFSVTAAIFFIIFILLMIKDL